jgi:hypothetical protein
VVGLKDGLDDVAVSWTDLPAPGAERIPLLVFETDNDPAVTGYNLRVYTVDEVTGEETDLGAVFTELSETDLAPYLQDDDLFDQPTPSASEVKGYHVASGTLAKGVTYSWQACPGAGWGPKSFRQ